MITVYNTELFKELQEKPEWETLYDQAGNPKDPDIPEDFKGPGRIRVTRTQITFHGKDNAFRVRKEVDHERGTVRIRKDVAERIEQLGNLSSVSSHFTESYYYVREAFARWLKKEFSKDELKMILEADRGLSYSLSLIQGYKYHLADAIRHGELDKKWGVDAAAFLAKVDKMAQHELMMIHEWSYYYWQGKWLSQPPVDDYVS